MTAVPRTMRPAQIPLAPRIRRSITAPKSRTFGRVTLFLCSIAIFFLVLCGYLWQDSQAVANSLQIPPLQTQLQDAQNRTAQLQSEIAHLKGFGAVTGPARKFGLRWPDGTLIKNPIVVNVPGPVHNVFVAPAAHHSQIVSPVTTLHLPTTTAAIGGWWETAWTTMSNVLH